MRSAEESSGQMIVVGVGALEIAQFPSALMTPALGSCVGLTLWDPVKHRAAMAHITLPSAADTMMGGEKSRFADMAVPLMVERLAAMGSPARRLQAKLAGGAAMFPSDRGIASIGERNVAEVRARLAASGIVAAAEDVGGSHARTIELRLDTGVLVVRSYLYGMREL